MRPAIWYLRVLAESGYLDDKIKLSLKIYEMSFQDGPIDMDEIID